LRKEQGTRNKKQETRNKEQDTRDKEGKNGLPVFLTFGLKNNKHLK
jgi:hypothetical protein